MESVRSKDGTAIAFDRSGQGSPVVLVGGALSDRAAAGPLAGALGPHLTVFAYDRRGRGDSGDTMPYAVEREVEDLEALVEEAGGSASLFGHSSGGALALEAAARGLAVPRLALYEPPYIVDDSRPQLPADYTERLEELVTAGRRGDAVEYFMTVAVTVPPEMVAQMRESPMWPALEGLAHTLRYDGAVMGDHMSGRPLPAEWAETVTMRTLVIDGGLSPEWARNAVRALADLLPDARYRTLEGQTHGADPQVLAPALLEFFRQGT